MIIERRFVRWAAMVALASTAGQAGAVFGLGSLDGTPYSTVGRVITAGIGSGTIISKRAVITARHNTLGFNLSTFTFNLEGFPVLRPIQKIEHPTADISILIFGKDFAEWTDPYFDDAVGQEIDVVGYGRNATLRADRTGFNDAGFFTSGTRRSARNVISRKVEYNGYQAYQFDYDSPFAETPEDLKDRFGDGGAIEGEGGTRRGDSGGAYFMTVGGKLRLAGVHTAGINLGGPGSGDSFNSDFGDASAGVALSDYRDWVEANLVPEPMTLAAMSVGFAVFLRRRRR